MKKIKDTWIVKAEDHKTKYYLYNDGKDYDICVSVARWKNGKKSFCMSDTRNELLTYGTQEEIENIIDELEMSQLKNKHGDKSYHL